MNFEVKKNSQLKKDCIRYLAEDYYLIFEIDERLIDEGNQDFSHQRLINTNLNIENAKKAHISIDTLDLAFSRDGEPMLISFDMFTNRDNWIRMDRIDWPEDIVPCDLIGRFESDELVGNDVFSIPFDGPIHVYYDELKNLLISFKNIIPTSMGQISKNMIVSLKSEMISDIYLKNVSGV